jgi:MFS family permease
MQSDESTAAEPIAGDGILSARYRLVTLGALAIVFLSAFENLAVTTIMPVISRELDGASLYAVSFAGPLAAGVVGMVLAGNWADRSGPRIPLYGSVALFAIGLVVAGFATTMWTVVIGRLVYGLAAGAMTVALYVIVARFYPARLQPQIFGAFAAAWVIPALVGPFIAGWVGETVGWRWVFLGVVVLVVLALIMVVPAMRELSGSDGETTVPWSVSRILWSVLLAVAVLGLSLSAELHGVLSYIVAVAALVMALVAVRPLLPRRTLSGQRGLPSVLLVRGVLAGAYFGAEVYLPYLLTGEFLLTPTMAGLSLTGAGVAWGLASWLQGKYSDRLGTGMSLRLGMSVVLLAVLASFATSFFGLPAWVAIAGWTLGGAGMGTVYPRLSVLTLGYSSRDSQGFNSAALSIADAVGPGVTLAVLGVLFANVEGGEAQLSFGSVFLVTVLLAAIALVMCGRVFLPRAISREAPDAGLVP